MESSAKRTYKAFCMARAGYSLMPCTQGKTKLIKSVRFADSTEHNHDTARGGGVRGRLYGEDWNLYQYRSMGLSERVLDDTIQSHSLENSWNHQHPKPTPSMQHTVATGRIRSPACRIELNGHSVGRIKTLPPYSSSCLVTANSTSSLNSKSLPESQIARSF